MRDRLLKVLELYAEGGTLQRARDQVGISGRDFYRAKRQNPDLQTLFLEIEEDRAHMMYDEAYQISTDDIDNPGSARVRAEIRMKIAAAFDRKRFGDKVQVDVNNTISVTGAIEAAKARALPPPCDPATQLASQIIDLEPMPAALAPDKVSGVVPERPAQADPAGLFDD